MKTKFRTLILFTLCIAVLRFFCSCNTSNNNITNVNTTNIDSIQNINFLNYKYKSLDSNYKIILPKDTFIKTVAQYKFNSNSLKKYTDSLTVALMYDLGNWQLARVANMQITYPWVRVGWHLWLDTLATLQLAKQLSISKPYQLLAYFKNDSIKSEIKNSCFAKLKTTLASNKNADSLSKFSTAQLLKYAFKHNPQVINNIAKFKAVEAEHEGH